MTAVTWKLTICILITSVLLAFPAGASAQVVINEFSSFSSDDWVELYNTTESNVNLNNWMLEDTSSTNNVIYEFKNSTTLPPYGYCVLEVGKRLNKGGDRIELFNGQTRKDCVAYGNGNKKFCTSSEKEDVEAPGDNQTAARQPNGTGNFVLTSTTRDYSNDESLPPANKVLCTSPTPEPSGTSKPTPVPTQTPTSSPKPTSTATPSNTPVPETKKTAAASTHASPSPTASPSVLGDKSESTKSETPLYAYLFIGLGVGLIGLAAAPLVKQEYNKRKAVNFPQNEPPSQNNSPH